MPRRLAIFYSLLLSALATLASCSEGGYTPSGDYPPIVPDYVGVTVPEGMAPLSFEMTDGSRFSFTTERVGDTLFYHVRSHDRKTGRKTQYKPFPVYISKDAIDPYIAYRLIEPSYEGWKEMGLYYRELSSYKEKALVTNAAIGGGCVNCHTFPGGDPTRMIFHARGEGGGTVFKEGDSFKKINLATIGPHKQGTYPAWHPTGRYIAFSSNSTQQSFPIVGSQQVEVYDHFSDIILMDLQTESVTTHPSICEETRMETFPTWSPDGDRLYFCVADSLAGVVENRSRVRYSIEYIPFEDGAFVGEPKTFYSCDTLSLSHPRINGKWMLLTGSAYGTFPIWHPEADLYLLDMEDGTMIKADLLNSQESDSYHSWSSNGKWVIFSSRRIDGRYTRLYLSHFDGQGHFTKPFLLPQKKYSHNVLRLKSYNVPEFIAGDPGELDKEISKLFVK